MKKENIKLLIKEAIKKIMDTVLMFAVVLGELKLIPIAKINVNARKPKPPPINSV